MSEIPPGFRIVHVNVPGLEGAYLLNERAFSEPFAFIDKPVMRDPYAGKIDPKKFMRDMAMAHFPITSAAVMKPCMDPMPFNLVNVDPPFSRGDAKAARRTWHKRKRASKYLARIRRSHAR